MSTSPSWFDQEKFSRLVKKVGTKPAGGQPAPKTEPAPAPTPVAKAPAVVENKTATPPRDVKVTGILPKISIGQSLAFRPATPAAPAPIVPPPIRSDAGPAPVEEPKEEAPEIEDKFVEEAKEEPKKEEAPAKEEVSALPEAVKRPPISAQRMMTSQALTLGKPRTSPLSSPGVPPREEPIRAPEPSEDTVRRAPPLPGAETKSSGLPARTTSLPALKSLFQYESPSSAKSVPEPPAPNISFPKTESKAAPEVGFPSPELEEEDEPVPSLAGLAEAGHVDDLPEELTAESLAADWGKASELNEEIERLTKERDDALAESDALLQQLNELREAKEAKEEEKTKEPETPSISAEEHATVTKERDQVRGEYIKLREEFETLKRENSPAKGTRGKLNEPVAAHQKELEELRKQLADKDREIHAVKTTTSGMDDAVESLKKEVNDLKEQAKKAKDDASMAQRGLILSQKALQETREALREASEGKAKSDSGSLKK